MRKIMFLSVMLNLLLMNALWAENIKEKEIDRLFFLRIGVAVPNDGFLDDIPRQGIGLVLYIKAILI